MKNIPNLTFTAKELPSSTELLTTASLIKITLAQAPANGFSFGDIRQRTKVADACDAAKEGGEISLEDADYTVARKCVEDFRWGTSHPDLLKFAEQFGL